MIGARQKIEILLPMNGMFLKGFQIYLFSLTSPYLPEKNVENNQAGVALKERFFLNKLHITSFQMQLI